MKRYFPSMKHYSWIVVICVVLATAAGAVMAKSQPPAYLVTASLLVRAGAPGTTVTGATASSADSIPQADDDVVEIVTRSVMERVYLSDPRIHARHYTPDDLLVDITAAAPSTTASNIVITATAVTPADAVMLATDVARTYKQYKDGEVQQQLSTMRTSLQNQLNTLQSQINSLEIKINALPSTTVIQFATLNQDLTRATNNMNAVNTQLLNLPQTVQSDVFITQLPKVTDATASSKTTLVIAVTFGLGLVLGLLIMFLVIFLDNRLYGEDRVRDKLGFAYLGGLSNDHGLKRSPMQAKGAAMQDVGDICANLRLTEVLPDRWQAPQGAVLLVTSNRTAEGKTTIASALAATVARGGGTVAVVDGNLRHPTTHLAFGISPAGAGLSGLLRGNGTENIDNVVQRSALPGVWLLASGSAMDDPTYLLGQRLPGILAQLRTKTDLVIIDGPPLLSGADAVLIATMVDGVAIVVDARYDKMPLLLRAKEILSSLSNKPAGIILNHLPSRQKDRYFVTAYPGSTAGEKRVPPVEVYESIAANSNGNRNRLELVANSQQTDIDTIMLITPPSLPVPQQQAVRTSTPPSFVVNAPARPAPVPRVQSQELVGNPLLQQPNTPSSRPAARRMDMAPPPSLRPGRDE